MAEIHELKTERTANQAAAIDILERMLQSAKDGKVAAVAVAFVRSDRVSASWSWSSSDCSPAVIGAIAGMQVAMIADSFMQRKPLT